MSTSKILRKKSRLFATKSAHLGARFVFPPSLLVLSYDLFIGRHYNKRQITSCSSSISKATTKARVSSLFSRSHLIILFPLYLSVRKSLPRFSRASLKSHQIITLRSAVPAVHARPRKSLVSSRDKERLLRIARKDRRGPLNSIVDPSQPGAGSALLEVSEAVKKSGQYDVWSAEAAQNVEAKVKVCAAPSQDPSPYADAVSLSYAGTRCPPPTHRNHSARSSRPTCRNVV